MSHRGIAASTLSLRTVVMRVYRLRPANTESITVPRMSCSADRRRRCTARGNRAPNSHITHSSSETRGNAASSVFVAIDPGVRSGGYFARASSLIARVLM